MYIISIAAPHGWWVDNIPSEREFSVRIFSTELINTSKNERLSNISGTYQTEIAFFFFFSIKKCCEKKNISRDLRKSSALSRVINFNVSHAANFL